MEYTIPKGVFDILPEEVPSEEAWRTSEKWQYLEETIRAVSHSYGYREIRTPIFEKTELFIRSVGEGSDIVNKEMYTFEDRGGRSMTLRPEGTASAMRAVIENRLTAKSPLQKLYYIGPMFRYERPQAGRYRQHHQFGAEAIGISLPEQDVETIDLLCELYRQLKISRLTIHLNSIGNEECRKKFQLALTAFLKPHFDSLSEESKVRFQKNILRILDSKDPNDQKIIANAPSILDMLDSESKEHFHQVQQLLKKLKLPFQINPKLVRGLDYYNKTVFEIISGELGAQNSIGGGGRYDGLMSLLDGPNLPAVGFATGMERILQTMLGQKISFPSPISPFIYLIFMGDEARKFCFSLLYDLRHSKIPSEMDLQGKKIGNALQFAEKLKAKYALIIGEDELKQQMVKLKELETRQERTVPSHNLIEEIKKLANYSFI
ncbi:MAG: histidine--tRNA ligase [Chlamydiae bacterium]|nr:histidine--tRNA ligase [Chlamydiota bacterium]